MFYIMNQNDKSYDFYDPKLDKSQGRKFFLRNMIYMNARDKLLNQIIEKRV